MDKKLIAKLLDEKHQKLIHWLEDQDDEKWELGPEGKWTTGQVTLHLLQSIKPLNTALSLPKFILRYKFGTSNREVRDYDTVVNRYQERLKTVAQGTTFGPSRNMGVPKLKEKQYLLNRLQVESKKLQYKTKKMSDKHLDNLVLPHPLMGKMPIRELLMWTSYHVEHHTNQLLEQY
ncbi:DinB family protein [Flavobacteriaceae bacterium LMO-SS05]